MYFFKNIPHPLIHTVVVLQNVSGAGIRVENTISVAYSIFPRRSYHPGYKLARFEKNLFQFVRILYFLY